MRNSQKKTKETSLSPKQKLNKLVTRIFDVLFSLTVLVVISPILIILSIWIIIDDGFPVFFKQKRSGKNNEVFLIYKFRSMKNEQVPVKSNILDTGDWDEGVPDSFIFKTTEENNPNITKVGRFIRKYSLDELPQFINVLKGDMSIIGPRPEILSISNKYNDEQLRRLEVKPGISGWAQVNGRSNMDHGEKIKNDLYYVENKSFFLDIKIILKTIVQVIFGKGAV